MENIIFNSNDTVLCQIELKVHYSSVTDEPVNFVISKKVNVGQIISLTKLILTLFTVINILIVSK